MAELDPKNPKEGARFRYESDLSMVKQVLSKLDPINLMKHGAPADEYDQEAAKIVAGLRRCTTTQEVQQLIYTVFEELFGREIAGNSDLYREAATKIFHSLKPSLGNSGNSGDRKNRRRSK